MHLVQSEAVANDSDTLRARTRAHVEATIQYDVSEGIHVCHMAYEASRRRFDIHVWSRQQQAATK